MKGQQWLKELCLLAQQRYWLNVLHTQTRVSGDGKSTGTGAVEMWLVKVQELLTQPRVDKKSLHGS